MTGVKVGCIVSVFSACKNIKEYVIIDDNLYSFISLNLTSIIYGVSQNYRIRREQ